MSGNVIFRSRISLPQLLALGLRSADHDDCAFGRRPLGRTVVLGALDFPDRDEGARPRLAPRPRRLRAASVAGAYPLLAVVPNVVKMNWAREVERWTPQRRATVIHGDGETGAALVRHPGVDLISFTGSTEVGREVALACADSY